MSATSRVIPPLYLAATCDKQMRGDELRVLAQCYDLLPDHDWGPIADWYVAERMGVHQANICRALRRLVRAGYLERHKVLPRDRTWLYRLAPAAPVRRSA